MSTVYLNWIVKGFENTNIFIAHLQIHGTFHVYINSIMFCIWSGCDVYTSVNCVLRVKKRNKNEFIVLFPRSSHLKTIHGYSTRFYFQIFHLVPSQQLDISFRTTDMHQLLWDFVLEPFQKSLVTLCISFHFEKEGQFIPPTLHKALNLKVCWQD
jgi:hypothetical protein